MTRTREENAKDAEIEEYENKVDALCDKAMQSLIATRVAWDSALAMVEERCRAHGVPDTAGLKYWREVSRDLRRMQNKMQDDLDPPHLRSDLKFG